MAEAEPHEPGTLDWTDVIDVANRIDEIEQTPPPGVTFSPSRWPYLYAYDYMRSHSAEFGLPAFLSRADCAGLVRSEHKEAVVRLLADAYLKEHHIAAPDDRS